MCELAAALFASTHARVRAAAAVSTWAGRTLRAGAPFQMEAAPRKPTPEGMAALTRDESQPIVPSTNANIESMVKTHEPRHTIAIVRIPAGRSARRRSKPMIEPITIDMTTRQDLRRSTRSRAGPEAPLRLRHAKQQAMDARSNLCLQGGPRLTCQLPTG